MFRVLVPVTAVCSVLLAAQATLTSQTSQGTGGPNSVGRSNSRTAPSPPAAHGEVIDRYCVRCHNPRLKTAGLVLDKANLTRIGDDAAVWEKVAQKLRAEAMPPGNLPRPPKETADSFVSWLEFELEQAALVKPNPGTATIHRLNRTEYVNAIRDLLGLEVDGASLLPPDSSGYGFDNVADTLTVSPLLLERYLVAAERLSRLAIGSPIANPRYSTYYVSPLLPQDEQMSMELPFGSRGGGAVRHYFPLDGEYVVNIRLARTGAGNENVIKGHTRSSVIDVLLDRQRLQQLSFGGEPKSLPADYRIRGDANLSVRFQAKAGLHTVGVTFPKQTTYPEDVRRVRLPILSRAHTGLANTDPELSAIEIGGPFNATGPGDTVSRRALLVCEPSSPRDNKACATKILTKISERAYRRPVTERDLRLLMGCYETGHRQAGSFNGGIERALRCMLTQPDFLFRIERQPANIRPGAAYRITDIELASRLSFFLWSSVPDDELRNVAVRGRLKNPKVLEQQVRRMLNDPRAQALVSNFGGQWLWLRNIRSVRPDVTEFPFWDDSLRLAMERETGLFLESMLREDRGVPELLDANYTFLNERLARHYGISNVYGTHFRRVNLGPEQANRRGLLGQGSILTVTSHDNRTSPVKRGKWLLENFFGTPPPAPPPNVPALREEKVSTDGQVTTVRQRMEEHRNNAACAACHASLDPLGLAMENFDAIGQWRDTEGGLKVDASAELPNGTTFTGPVELRGLFLRRREEFVRTVTEKLMTYALGRGVEYYDLPTVRRIVKDASVHDYRWSAVILGIVKSLPFQMRTAVAPAIASPTTTVASRK